MKMRNVFKRFIASVLAFVLAVPAGAGNILLEASAAEASPISINLDWVDSEFKNGAAFQLQESEDVSNAVKMKVSYESSLIREEGYAPGELIITVKGIGKVNRSGAIEALVGADKEGASSKTRDWTYTWNKANDTYTLTNNEEIKGNSVFSGYFELVWNVEARDSIDRYTQNGIQATMYLPDGDSVSSNKLSFSNDTKADSFAVHIDLQEMYSYEGLTAGISNPNDYAFIRYNLGVTETKSSRGLKSSYYLFDPDDSDAGSGAIVISPALTCSDQENGTYHVGMSTSASMVNQYIFVAYPKNNYKNKTINASISKYGAYYEGDDSGDTGTLLLAKDTIAVPIPNDFNFIDIPGTVYQFWKDTYYDQNVSYEDTQAKGGDISGTKMKSGTTQTFYLEGELHVSHGLEYSLEIVDDFIYILKNNGNYRQLEAGEYTFKTVTIPGAYSMRNANNTPITADTYQVYVYAVKDGAKIEPTNQSPVWQGVITNSSQKVTLPAGTTAFAVVIQDIAESIMLYSIPLEVQFHIKDTSGLSYMEQDNLTSGQVANTCFINVYTKNDDGSYSWFNNDFGLEHYKDDTNLNLAQKDLNIYGSYLDRERDNITFYESEKNDYSAYTLLSEIKSEGGRFVTTLTMGADFEFAENERPSQFSLYTILDKALSLSGYRISEDIWDIMRLSGLDMSEEQLASVCTPEVITNYNGSGRTYIALHFDFGDTQVPQSSEIRAVFKTRVDNEYLKNSYAIRGRSAVIIDESILEYPAGKVTDIGEWGDTTTLFHDIDRDGNTSENLAYDFSTVSYVYADSSQLQLTKYVQTSYSDGWTQLPDVPYEEFGGTYQYNLYLKNGNSQATNIIVKDILEVGSNKQWQGTFQSVDLSKCTQLGITGTVYYSAKANPAAALSSSDWSTTKPASVKAIAVDFGSSVLKEGQELNIIVNMKAPADTSLKNKITENGYSASFTMTDASSGNVTKYDNLVSNFVQVKLTSPLKSVIITKQDAETGATLAGAQFSLINKSTGETVAEATSNGRGYAIFRNVPADVTYIIRETKAPTGYSLGGDVEVAMNGTDQRLTIKNPRKTGRIEVYKVNNLDKGIPVQGAVYALYNADNSVAATATTNAQGIAVFESVKWGNYTVKETSSPAGYSLNETAYPVAITRQSVSETVMIETVDVQDDVSVRLNKYVSTVDGKKTETPLAGATFELVRKTSSGNKRVGLYVTDSAGKIDVVDLPYGNYYFREYRTPAGYITADNVEFSLSPTSKNASVTVYNQREAGSILITKKDNLGNLLENIQFSLYKENNTAATPVATAKTDEYGVAQFENLDWGTYYLLETSAPEYYEMDTQWKEVTIGARTLQVTLDVINKTVKGSVILKKTNEAGTVLLPGAEYTLYLDDGTVVGKYTTDANGQIKVENLEWGGYYFKETKAPSGYSLSDETVRFSINALNAGIPQEIEVTDPLDAKSITLTKRVMASDVNFDNGNPIFIFKVEGTDIYGASHTYYRSVAFDESFVTANTDSSGYASLSVIISDVIAGKYTATEMETSRYYLTGITNPVNGTVSGDKVVFDLSTTAKKTASAVFTNRNYEQQDFSDAQILTNILKQKTRLTALKVSYGATTAEAESAVITSLLKVVAYYDDGTTKDLSGSDYVLSIKNFPNSNGNYTVKVSYTENGITRSDSFTVTLYGMKERITSITASLKDTSPVYINSAITADMFTVKATYNTGKTETISAKNLVLSRSAAPSTDGNFTVKITLNQTAYPNTGSVSATVTMTAELYPPILAAGATVNGLFDHYTEAIYFTDTAAPTGAVLTDVSAAGNETVVAWEQEEDVWYISSQRPGVKVIANADSSSLFANKQSVAIIDVTKLDVSGVNNMASMFESTGASVNEFTVIGLGTWNTGNVTNMSNMFKSTAFRAETFDLGDISKWNTTKVTDMSSMFEFAFERAITFDLGDIGTKVVNAGTANEYIAWDTCNVETMANMFNSAGQRAVTYDLSSISKWNTTKVEDMSNMFKYAAGYFASATYQDGTFAPLDLSTKTVTVGSKTYTAWNVTNVQTMAGMFANAGYHCVDFSLNLTGWNTINVRDMSTMFNTAGFKAKTFSLTGLNTWKTGNVTNMSSMFNSAVASYTATAPDITFSDISGWDTSNVTNMDKMFWGFAQYGSGTLNLSKWDVSDVTSHADFNANSGFTIAVPNFS